MNLMAFSPFIRNMLMSALLLVLPIKTGNAQGLRDSLAPYTPIAQLSGGIKIVGSDSMNNVISKLSEQFRKIYPGITIEIEGKGSASAPPALVEGTAQIGAMSRPMKKEEVALFRQKYNVLPTRIRLAVDAVAVFVNKDNPIKCLTLPQLDAIFSSTRKAGLDQDLQKWEQLSLKDPIWINKPIITVGRNAASGTYAFFKDTVLQGGDFKPSVKEQPGSSSVVQIIGRDKYAIGYSGLEYKTPETWAIDIADDKGNCVHASQESAYNSSYPLARFLYLYILASAKTPLNPALSEFIKFSLSSDGQKIVKDDGYFPVPMNFVQEDKGLLGLE
ncbi:MAG: PstS family phosphate ABC transporter substrate-binding protein [Alphaproteobacteria bacterium]